MKPEEDLYKQTIEVYKKLGKKYINNIKSLTPPEFYDFIKLLPKNSRILEIGCTGGRDAKKFVQRGFKVIAIDLVEIFLKEARKKVPQAEFIKMDMTKLKFPNNYFDAIWANAILLHLKREDVLKTLRGFYRVLKKSGKLHIRVKKGTKTTYQKDKLSNGEKRFFIYFSKSELEKFVNKAGFKIIISRILPDDAGRKNLRWISLWAEK